jgi:hypothetical protein
MRCGVGKKGGGGGRLIELLIGSGRPPLSCTRCCGPGIGRPTCDALATSLAEAGQQGLIRIEESCFFSGWTERTWPRTIEGGRCMQAG